MCENNKECNCISEILKVIAILQKNADCVDGRCLDSCDRGFLGNGNSIIGLNTRPVMLYIAASNGLTPWTMPTTKTDEACGTEGVVCSSVFRIEKIDGCCATFRVLADNPDETTAIMTPYLSTNSFFTMNLNCICCIRCLNDTYVDINN